MLTSTVVVVLVRLLTAVLKVFTLIKWFLRTKIKDVVTLFVFHLKNSYITPLFEVKYCSIGVEKMYSQHFSLLITNVINVVEIIKTF